ncbi:MAG: PAS domain S-box protein [Methanoregula sp.]|nr:MAG: PAS domain S-box protein [Methanoregula sp.]
MISVLCVDDEQVLLDLYKLFLEKSGEIEVDTADSVKTAVKKLKKTRYDVIVSDYAMPEYDGVAFLKCILPTYGDIPFIIFTGKGCEDTVIEALNTGARFYVQKGDDPKKQFADLVDKIKQAVGLKAAKEALRNSEIRYRKLFETANDGILLIDAETGEIINANPFLLTLIGSSPEEILGKNLLDTGIFRDADLVKKAFLDLQTEKNIGYKELPLVAKNGQEIIVEFVCTVYTVDHTDIIQCNVRDITGRRQAEEALRIVREKYTKAFISAPDAITISELDSGRFVEVNEAATAIFGYSHEELIGKSAGELGIWLKKEDRDAFVDQLKEHGRVHQYEVVERRKSGELFNASVTADTIAIGNSMYLIAIIRDISELKRAEEQLRHFNEELEKGIAERTEKLNASLEEKVLLLREVHHRVNNNLQIILSLIRLQSRTIKDPQFLDTMGEFHNRIMAMAHVHERIYSSENISRIGLSEIVRFLGTSLFRTYNADPQQIRLNIETNNIQVPVTSAIPLSLILNELISNSLKHAFVQGTTGEITIAGRREDDNILLLIKDTGIGMPADLDWRRHEQSLGLRLVMGLVEQLNGTIELDRTAGTAFTIVVKEKE